MGAPKCGRHKSSPQRAPILGVGRWKQLEPQENWGGIGTQTAGVWGSWESPLPLGEQINEERAAAQVPILALLLGSCVTLGKGLYISEPRFPHSS